MKVHAVLLYPFSLCNEPGLMNLVVKVRFIVSLNPHAITCLSLKRMSKLAVYALPAS